MSRSTRSIVRRRLGQARWGLAIIILGAILLLITGAETDLFGTTTLAEVQVVSFSKVFVPNIIGPGSTTTLSFSIVNPDPALLTNLIFTDTLPSGVLIATPSNATTSCTNAALDAPDGGDTISFSEARLEAYSACFITVDVTSSTPGIYQNVSEDLTSDAGNHGNALADLTVATNRPGFSKSFAPSSIPLGGRNTLTFLIDNTSNGSAATSLAFADIFPPGLVIADPANASNTCAYGTFTGGILTAEPGTSVVSLLSGPGLDIGAVDAGATCTISVDVTATGAGLKGNITGELTHSAGSNGKASAILEVTVDPLSLVKSFSDDPTPPGGLVTLDFTITNYDRSNDATSVSFSDDLDAALAGLAALGPLPSDPCGPGSQLSGSSVITLSGGNIPAQGSCTFSVTLQVPLAASAGPYTNTTSTVTGTVDGSPVVGNAASDNLFVDPVPVFTKEFIDDPVTGGVTVTLRFTIRNTDPTASLIGIEFTDDIGGSVDPRAGALPGLAANSLVAVSGLEPDPLVDPCGTGSMLTIPDPNDDLPPTFPPLPLIRLYWSSLAAASRLARPASLASRCR